MATPSELTTDGGPLVKMNGNLRGGELPYRSMYASHEAIAWIKDNINHPPENDFHDDPRSPLQQAVEIIHAFVAGDDLDGELEPHIMDPKEEGIWVIRTSDLRMYGWFYRPSQFILSCVEFKVNVVGNSVAYAALVEICCSFRDELDLDEPKTEFGDLEHVTRV